MNEYCQVCGAKLDEDGHCNECQSDVWMECNEIESLMEVEI